VRQHTFIHCSTRRIDSRLRAMTAGSTRSSANSSRLPCLVDVASTIGAKRIDAPS
jgi:hypothetical protein